MGKATARSIAVADQALAVIRDSDRELSTPAIASAIGVHPAEAYRVLRRLHDKRLISFTKYVDVVPLMWWYDGVGAENG